MATLPDKSKLERLYRKYNRPEFIHPDPLEFVWRYLDPADREIAGLISSGLAYGNVKAIEASSEKVLGLLTDRPSAFLDQASPRDLRRLFAGFRHRWTDENDLLDLLDGIHHCRRAYGSVGACFLAGSRASHRDILPAAEFLVQVLGGERGPRKNSLLSDPSGGSACKRLFLFFRWMIRKDRVDPGGWKDIPKSRLIVPLDTHMFRIAGALHWTKRKQPNLAAALEITEQFRRIAPRDPIRYDFALTRLGIRDDTDMDAFLATYTST